MKTTFDVIVLTETWLNNVNMNDYSIQGYDSYHSVRENRIGGGVALYMKNGFQCKGRRKRESKNTKQETRNKTI